VFEGVPEVFLCMQCDWVLVGRVDAVQGYWRDIDIDTIIVTDVHFTAEARIHGDPPPSLTIAVLGGDVEGQRLNVSHGFSFREGQRAILGFGVGPAARNELNGDLALRWSHSIPADEILPSGASLQRERLQRCASHVPE